MNQLTWTRQSLHQQILNQILAMENVPEIPQAQVDELRSLLEQILGMNQYDQRIAALEVLTAQMGLTLQSLQQTVSNQSEQITLLTTQMGLAMTSLTSLTNRVTTIEASISSILQSISSINTSLSSISNQLEGINQSIYLIEDEIDSLDERVSALEHQGTVDLLYVDYSDRLYADSLNGTSWKLAASSNRTYYHVYEITGVVTTIYLTTVGSYRTRILFTDYDPVLFRTQVKGSTLFTVTGLFAANLSNEVTRQQLINPGTSYLYIYTGNYEGTVTIELE